jgi:non-ribosomal peptide synthetase component F
MPMTGASMFWLDTLHDCHLDRSLPLPYDRYRLVSEYRTNRGISISFDFGQNLSHRFFLYAISNNINPQHMALTCYYAFLFKLSNGERNLCVGMDTHGRYKEELMTVVGLFGNTIPLRCQLDPHWSFIQLSQNVQEMMTSILEYSYFPLQRILAQHPNTSKPAFLDTTFDFLSSGNQNRGNKVIMGDSQLHLMPMSININENEILSKFDFGLNIHYNQSTNQLSCKIDASLDLFNATTIDKIAQRFHSMLEHLLNITDLQINKPIYELSLLLPDDRLLMQSMNNTQVLLPSASSIYHQFASQAIKHPQKLAVELDDQSLTYSEFLYYTQVLSLSLLKNQKVIVGEIVCQCIERSLSMVS